jgi:hypothetical protein
MGTPIEEAFDRRTHAKWNSPEEGRKDRSAPSFFVLMSPYPDSVGFPFTASEGRRKRSRWLDGEARLEKTTETTIRDKKLVGWAITAGADADATLADVDGTYFGVVDNWYSCVSEGWEDAIGRSSRSRRTSTSSATRRSRRRPTNRPRLACVHTPSARRRRKRIDDQTVVVVGDNDQGIRSVEDDDGAEGCRDDRCDG